VLGLLQPLVEKHELGMSTGKGFYRYPDPDYQKPGFVDGEAETDTLYRPLSMALIASAVLVAAADVAEPVDIDRAWTVGTSLDRGPFALLDEMGKGAFLEAFRQHVARGWFDPDNAHTVIGYCEEEAE
jgi:3-hydroxybutyryl-CoA dehydrogenase